MSDDERAFLAQILAEPADDTARLVYADWLEEHGGRPERAAFVRVQVELAAPFVGPCRGCGRPLGDDRIADGCPCNTPRGVNHGIVPAYVCTCPGCDPEQTGSVRDRPAGVKRLVRRERELLLNFPAAPYWGLPESLNGTHPGRDTTSDEPAIRCFGKGVREMAFHFRRGFAESVTCEPGDWFRYAGAIRAAHPVTRVKFTRHVIPGRVHRADGARYTLNPTAGLDRERVLSIDYPGKWTDRFPRLDELLAAEWPGIEFDEPQ